MTDLQRLVNLTDAIWHLCRARDELLAAGYVSWAGGLLELFDTIALEMDWLSTEAKGPEAAA